MAKTRVSAKQRREQALAQLGTLPKKELLKSADLHTLEELIKWCDDFKETAEKQVAKYAEAKEEFTAAQKALKEAQERYNKIASKLGK